MADLDLATILADGEYLKRAGDTLVGEIPATGTPGAVDAEGAVDAAAAALAAGTHTNVTVTYDDTANSISLAAAAGGVTDPELLAIAGLTSAADQVPYFTGSGTAALTTVTSAARGVLDEITVNGMRVALGVGIGGTDSSANATVAPVRRILVNNTATTYAPTNGQENQFVTLSNAGAITVTMPSNATSSIPIGAEMDFLWLGVGQPTFVAGSGATVNSAFGLSMPARYSVVTAKKIASNDWVLYQAGSTVRLIVTYTGTAVTGALTDGGAYLRFTGTNPTYTVPPNSAVAFPVGTQIDGIGTATAMTIIAGSGVTITKARTLVTVGAGSGWTLIKTGTDTWDTHGDYV